ncbi:MAG: VOC family protein [Gemmatimonadetes bacterium]|uniref:VOC family protein n=1 Tax=Candidatus Kutchimonas denitrificans TaxID=3056748 RepID=A0AAE4ZDK6_9BACT|nr:VOC family protein [Gemmatimonadota bacterium]NIR76570.1 VOC family protein [Candidatus Kutchimonas denitrificans]NIS01126.1 VOC family protein [Gemmatimonadota bacterium]NIT66893.1 VOC family protein [Gemmatimonadota bacterium]NIU54666.1 VOC family protein [Gemmatimonadota bacterium]
MPDIGFTHVALPVTSLQASIDFYGKYAGLQVVHRREQDDDPERGIAWLSDRTRPFVLVLVETDEVDAPLGPFAHLGVACPSRESVDQLCEAARAEGRLRREPWDSESPAGYLAMLSDPDGHTLELSHGQETGLAVESHSHPEPGADE